jgi:hypothetical protein
MKAVVIDRAGSIITNAPEALVGRYASPYALTNLLEYMVTVLGFVAIDRFGTTCQIRFAPSRIADATLDATIRSIVEQRAHRFVLAEPSDGWRYHIFPDAHQAVSAFVNRIAREAARAPLDERLERRIEPGEVERDDIRSLVNSWDQIRASRDDAIIMAKAEAVLKNRLAVVTASPDRAHLTLSYISNGFSNYDESWRKAAVGANFAEQPDRNYGAWVARTYEEALRDGVARVFDVDALISTPSTGSSRMRFKRLVLPAMMADGSRVAIGGSVVDDNIDLRNGISATVTVPHRRIDLFEAERRALEQRTRARAQ